MASRMRWIMCQQHSWLIFNSRFIWSGAKRSFGVQHDEDRDKPLPQADMRLVEDRASRRREAIATTEARPLSSGRQFADLIARATGTLDAIRPANLHKMSPTRFVVGKLFKQPNQIHGFAVRLCDESAKMKLLRLQSAETSGCGLPRPCCKHRRGFLTPVLSWPRLRKSIDVATFFS